MRYGLTNRECPKCGGNTYIDMDYYLEGVLINWYEQESCLQCGYTIYDLGNSQEELNITTRVTSAKKEPLFV